MVAKGNKSSQPDRFCNLSDTVVIQLLRANLTTRDLNDNWPQTFRQPRKDRPNMGYPAFPDSTEVTDDQVSCYAVFKQGYLLCGDYRAAELWKTAPESLVHWLQAKGKEKSVIGARYYRT